MPMMSPKGTKIKYVVEVIEQLVEAEWNDPVDPYHYHAVDTHETFYETSSTYIDPKTKSAVVQDEFGDEFDLDQCVWQD